MTTMPTVTAASLAAAANTGSARTEEEDAASNAFAALMRSVGSRFTTNGVQAVEAGVLREVATRTDPKPTEARDPAPKSTKDDDQVNAANDRADAAQDRKADNDADAQKKDDNDAAAAKTAVDPNQSAQIAAVQVQILNLAAAQAAPTVTVAPTVVVATPAMVTAAPVAAQAAAAAAQQTNTDPTAAAAQTAQTQQQTSATVTAAAAQTAAPTQTTLAAPVAKQAAVKSDAAATLANADAQAAPTQTTTATAAPTTAKTPEAQTQSAALSRLLGDDNAIRVAVTVDAPKAATPSINPYNHFVGYSAGENAGLSNANGQAGDPQAGNALLADTATPEGDGKTDAAQLVAQAATAAVQTGGTATATVRGDVSTPLAVTSIAAPSGADAAPSDLGQSGLGQAGVGSNSTPSNTSAVNNSNATEATRSPATAAQVFDQIKVQITRATKAGHDSVSIQLRPDDLGRIDVKLEVEKDGKVRATVVADNPETLKLMQSDARGLERALNDAGLRTDANTLQFSLRGESGSNQASANTGNGTAGNQAAATTDETDPTYDYGNAALQRGGVDTYA